MAASPNNETSATQTLEPQHPSMNGEDSVPQPSQPSQQDLDQGPSNPQSASADDTVSVGEKRKREDPPPSDQSSLHPLWKTSLCSYFRRNSGSCSHGDSCRYAHSEEELRPRPDNTWDPTSWRAKNALRSEESERQERPEEDVMMTEAVVDEDDGDKDNDGCSDSGLSKCLVHLPMKWNSEDLMEFLGEQGVHFKSVKKKKGMTVGFVSFESAVQLKTAQEELKGKSIGNKNLKVADVIPRSFEKRIRSAAALPIRDQQTREPKLDGENVGVPISSNGIEDGDTNNDDKNCLTVDGSVSRARSARDVVTPLAHMSYGDQLEHKKNSLMQILKRLTRNARKACPNGVSLPEWILKSREIGGLPCELEGIIESPLVNGYRNKCEFSAGYSLQGKPTVGFMLGNFREGVTAVEEPVDCPNVSRIACKYASIFQEFLQNSGLPIWNRFKNTGFWRQLTVREGRAPGKVDVENSDASISEVMLVVQVCSAGFDDAVITGEFKRLAEVFTEGAAENSVSLPLTALVVQDHQGISNVAPTDAPLCQLPIPKAAGPEPEATADPVEDHPGISNVAPTDAPLCQLPIPKAAGPEPEATTDPVEVNTLAAEKLYSLAGDWAGLGPDTLLFDVCCGTGTIGLTLAHRVGMVIGIEMNASAVSDAYRNAEINGIKNCKFVCAKAEDVMGSLLKEYLNLPQKSDEISNTSESSESSDKEIATPGEKDTSIDNVLEPEENSGHDHVNNKSASDCLENGGQETGIQQQGNGTSESGNTSVPQFKNVVAIVDPPRVGLHPIVIKALRTHPRLHRLVYISCNPDSLVANAIELCTPSPQKIEKGNKNNRGWRSMSSAGLARHRVKSMPISEPFRPVKAMAVDLFPHTVHCEMVMLLER
ncbi:hypothetical protein I3760_14G082900 [Carya illinoinensis]|nr:hypothetical protein I3760_14G082900 [Carya illinoinensis]